MLRSEDDFGIFLKLFFVTFLVFELSHILSSNSIDNEEVNSLPYLPKDLASLFEYFKMCLNPCHAE